MENTQWGKRFNIWLIASAILISAASSGFGAIPNYEPSICSKILGHFIYAGNRLVEAIPFVKLIGPGYPIGSVKTSKQVFMDDFKLWDITRRNRGKEAGLWEILSKDGVRLSSFICW